MVVALVPNCSCPLEIAKEVYFWLYLWIGLNTVLLSPPTENFLCLVRVLGIIIKHLFSAISDAIAGFPNSSAALAHNLILGNFSSLNGGVVAGS